MPTRRFLASLICMLGLTALPAAPALAEPARPSLAQEAETLGRRAQAAADKGALDEALGLFKRSLAADPRGREALVGLAGVLSDMERWEDARKAYERAVASYPDDPNVLNGLGYVFYRQARWDQAIACYERALTYREDPQYHLNLGLALLSQDRYGQAEDQFRLTLDMAPGHYWALNNLGYSLYLQGRRHEAARAYWAALRSGPPGVTTHLNLARLLMEERVWPEAARVYREALKQDDELAEAHRGLAHALGRLGRDAEARLEALVAFKLDPDAAAAHELAGVLARAGEVVRAIRLEVKAIAEAPQVPAYRLARARLLERAERYDEAIRAYEDYLALVPSNAEARLNWRLLREVHPPVRRAD